MSKEVKITFIIAVSLMVVIVARLVLKSTFDSRSRASEESSSAYQYINTKVSSEK